MILPAMKTRVDHLDPNLDILLHPKLSVLYFRSEKKKNNYKGFCQFDFRKYKTLNLGYIWAGSMTSGKAGGMSCEPLKAVF